MRELRQWDVLAPAELSRRQDERLSDLLRHAHRSTPYYHRILESAGVVDAGGAVSLSSFDRLPLLDKSTLSEHFVSLRSEDLAARKWFENRSGGSTGEPARFIQDSGQHAWKVAVATHFDGWTGYEMGARRAILWGSIDDLRRSTAGRGRQLRRWLRNELVLPAFVISETDVLRYAQALTAFRPTQILMYAETGHELALRFERLGRAAASDRHHRGNPLSEHAQHYRARFRRPGLRSLRFARDGRYGVGVRAA